ncbi:hypothetical protein A2W54_03710 [Candidatus Giovannonibacteria bacterium RIFCSPHIGHO2_02_43_13]|uniref:Vitamin K epoxide reductase domain-containing protein n=1 Tax=Candidatus Giovannonibacteria bacterium RIFCSPHIGHO2_02_43_13 TaxID=1798330 RepID=A0A1F5WRG0_9BACT|nr:MAG: hypothetical protein A2W54_03710 [Candidatus Giovannonibacteria bacterium RIFCSPHIGHO2_02_43_13]
MSFVPANIFLYFFLLILGISGFFFAAIWPQAVGFYAFIVFASAGGFGTAFYIFYTKRYRKQLVCQVGSDCNAVINSRYSIFLGIALEYWGMFYYAVIAVSYGALIFAPFFFNGIFLAGLLLASAGAFLFSLYLLFAQAFLLRQWCIWCILSAMLSIVIFIVSLTGVGFAVAFLTEIATVIELVRVLGFVFGIGGATAVLFLFHKFLNNRDIDESEARSVKGISELIWFGLFLTLLGQFALFAADAGAPEFPAIFFIQTTALFIATISGAVLMIIFAPFLSAIPFNEEERSRTHPSLNSLRKPMFIVGSVALSSWYFAFIIGYATGYGPAVLFVVYALTLAMAVAAAVLWEKKIDA